MLTGSFDSFVHLSKVSFDFTAFKFKTFIYDQARQLSVVWSVWGQVLMHFQIFWDEITNSNGYYIMPSDNSQPHIIIFLEFFSDSSDINLTDTIYSYTQQSLHVLS